MVGCTPCLAYRLQANQKSIVVRDAEEDATKRYLPLSYKRRDREYKETQDLKICQIHEKCQGSFRDFMILKKGGKCNTQTHNIHIN